MGLLPVNDGDEWMKLLNGFDLHELLVESPPKKKLTFVYRREVARQLDWLYMGTAVLYFSYSTLAINKALILL